MDSIIENVDENYEPVEPNYYHYTAVNNLYSTVYELLDGIQSYKVNICAFEVDNQHKYPFLKYLLYKNDVTNKVCFPSFYITRDKSKDITLKATNVLNKLLVGLAQVPEQYTFNGFKVFDNNIYMFFDATNCAIKHIELLWITNKIWFAIIDEIVNAQTICNIKIDECTSYLFLKSNDLCFLQNRQNKNYVLPVIAYVAKDEPKLHFTFVFGVSKSTNSDILGAYYYFTNYKTAVVTKDDDTSNHSQPLFARGIVRFALFIENQIFIENPKTLQNLSANDSEIGKDDPLLNRISNNNSMWAINYDSAYIGNILSDDGNYLKNTPIIVVRDYDQQVSLTYHYITPRANNSSTHDLM